MPLEVIGAGFGRTGTTTLKTALKQLGYEKIYHMNEVNLNPEHTEYWLSALNGADVDWNLFFKEYNAAVDWPTCTFYKQLMEKFPNAKVILTVRDPEKWYESVLNSIYQRHLARHQENAPPLLSDELVWGSVFDGNFTDKEHAIQVFNKNIEDVRASVPLERLLEFDVKSGWVPLCKFLGKEVPAEDFPHLNDHTEFSKRFEKYRAELAAKNV